MVEDDPVDRTSQMDQTLAGIRDVAAYTAAFYAGLVRNGVPPQVAAQLTGVWLANHTNGNRGG